MATEKLNTAPGRPLTIAEHAAHIATTAPGLTAERRAKLRTILQSNTKAVKA